MQRDEIEDWVTVGAAFAVAAAALVAASHVIAPPPPRAIFPPCPGRTGLPAADEQALRAGRGWPATSDDPACRQPVPAPLCGAFEACAPPARPALQAEQHAGLGLR